MKTVLVTGVAGFIGARVADVLLARGDRVIGVDNLNDYYDPALKQARLAHLAKVHAAAADRFTFHQMDLADAAGIADLFAKSQIDLVAHMGAQAGVRYSLENPASYIDSNITGTLNILEGCRHNPVAHLVYASSSSVYGANETMPYAEGHGTNHPLSLYAATKKSNELMAHTYSHLYDIPTTGLRFFTVYGPWGRPDMAFFKFTRAMLAGEPIDIYNNGSHKRDFTFIDDIVEGVVRALDHPAKANKDWSGCGTLADPATARAPYRVFNIGNGNPVALMDCIEVLEKALGIVAKKNFLPMQPGDVPATWCDTTALDQEIGYKPATSLEQGVAAFVAWYRDYYQV